MAACIVVMDIRSFTSTSKESFNCQVAEVDNPRLPSRILIEELMMFFLHCTPLRNEPKRNKGTKISRHLCSDVAYRSLPWNREHIGPQKYGVQLVNTKLHNLRCCFARSVRKRQTSNGHKCRMRAFSESEMLRASIYHTTSPSMAILGRIMGYGNLREGQWLMVVKRGSVKRGGRISLNDWLREPSFLYSSSTAKVPTHELFSDI